MRQVALEDLVATITGRLLAADDADVPDVIEQPLEELARAMGANRGALHARWPAARRDRRDRVARTRDRAALEGSVRHAAGGEPVVARRARRRVASCASTTSRCWPTRLPTSLEDLRRDAVRSVLHVPLPPHRGLLGLPVDRVGAHETGHVLRRVGPVAAARRRGVPHRARARRRRGRPAGRAPRARAPQRRARAVERGARAVRLRRGPRPEGAARSHRDGAGRDARARRATAALLVDVARRGAAACGSSSRTCSPSAPSADR